MRLRAGRRGLLSGVTLVPLPPLPPCFLCSVLWPLRGKNRGNRYSLIRECSTVVLDVSVACITTTHIIHTGLWCVPGALNAVSSSTSTEVQRNSTLRGVNTGEMQVCLVHTWTPQQHRLGWFSGDPRFTTANQCESSDLSSETPSRG